MSNQDTRVILVAPDGSSVYQESGTGAFSRTLKSLWAYAAQGVLHEDSEEQLLLDYPEFEKLLSHRLTKSHYYRVRTKQARVEESDRKKPRALHQIFVVPSRMAMMIFRHRSTVMDELSQFPAGEPCLIIVDDWSRAKSKHSSSPSSGSPKKEDPLPEYEFQSALPNSPQHY